MTAQQQNAERGGSRAEPIERLAGWLRLQSLLERSLWCSEGKHSFCDGVRRGAITEPCSCDCGHSGARPDEDLAGLDDAAFGH